MKIRLANHTDLPLIYKIDQAAFGNISNNFVTIRQMFDIAKDCFFVGELDKQLIGYAVGCNQFGSDSGWLLDIAVLSEQQGHGYGKRLIESVINTLSNAQIKKIRLVVQPDNNATKIYKNMGFTEESREANYYGTGERIVMVRQIDS
jgi:ribosomal-protein-alanine N-acetyltransferase